MTIQERGGALLTAGGLIIIGLSAACGPVSLPLMQSASDSASVVAQPAQAAAYLTPTPAAARTLSGPRPVPVKRDSLTETLSLDGMVAATTQEPVTFKWRAVVEDVKVKPGQTVEKGDILIDFSAGDANMALRHGPRPPPILARLPRGGAGGRADEAESSRPEGRCRSKAAATSHSRRPDCTSARSGEFGHGKGGQIGQ